MGDSPTALRQQILHWLAKNVPAKRVEHILRVEQFSSVLAAQHQLDPGKAAQAGLMHDLAKYFKPHVLLEMAHQEGLSLDPVDELNPHLLHADVSAIVARDRFGITDSQILAAIANHTLGHPDMDDLSCVVFLADSLEPGRGDRAELIQLRHLSQQDLHQAVWLTSDYTLNHLMETQRLIHPRALATRNAFLHRAKSKQAQTSEAIQPSSQR
ncbi:MAG: bis(5'-nucleosyl)-tetraphosphatase (symmetrical) YqeK [Elainella sp. Prado103]|jgi:predicted HD superfamily hydrolase involved in NAD metabolism|nr:bis(5'-nucleosyl)-tetraphosphatase (symmetrical) YqeK [Elainella sp. Prado103]